jgi:hypothetical protein
MNYSKSIGIFGDLVGLEDLPSRGHHLGRLRMLLDKINTTFRDKIKVDFTIISDTELKGAFDRSFPLQDFLALYHEEFGKEIGTHLGIGLGVLGDPEEKEPGGCFFSSRKAMAKAKENGKFIVFHGFEMNDAINALFHFIHEMDEIMTDRQHKVIEIYRKSGDIASISSELYIPKQGVLDSIKAAKYDIYNDAWRGLEKLIQFDVKLPSSAAASHNQQRPQRRDRVYQQSSQGGYPRPHRRDYQQRPSHNDQQRSTPRDYQQRPSHNDQQRFTPRDYQRPSRNDQQRFTPRDYQRPSRNDQQRFTPRDYHRPSYNDQQRPPHRDYRRPSSQNDPQGQGQGDHQRSFRSDQHDQQRPPRRDYQQRPSSHTDHRRSFGNDSHDNRRLKRPDKV